MTVFSGATGIAFAGLTITGSASYAVGPFGFSVGGAGDVDGDSVPDVIVGNPGTLGQVRVFSGATGVPITGPGLVGAAPYQQFGHAVAGAGDVSGDGVPDLIVGAPLAGAGQVTILSGATALLLPGLVFNGSVNYEQVGYSLAGGEDANGDGVPEVIVGVPLAISGGQVRVFSVVGLPAGSIGFGSGCPGTSGNPPIIQTAGGAPDATVGNANFQIVLSKALPIAPALLMGGVSNTFWAGLGLPLPVNLAALGFPACSLNVSAEVLFPTSTTADGIEFLPMPVPANAALAGQSVYFQWFVLDPPGAMTQGLEVVL